MKQRADRGVRAASNGSSAKFTSDGAAGCALPSVSPCTQGFLDAIGAIERLTDAAVGLSASDIFIDAVHFQPWVYHELNQLLLNALATSPPPPPSVRDVPSRSRAVAPPLAPARSFPRSSLWAAGQSLSADLSARLWRSLPDFFDPGVRPSPKAKPKGASAAPGSFS